MGFNVSGCSKTCACWSHTSNSLPLQYAPYRVPGSLCPILCAWLGVVIMVSCSTSRSNSSWTYSLKLSRPDAPLGNVSTTPFVEMVTGFQWGNLIGPLSFGQQCQAAMPDTKSRHQSQTPNPDTKQLCLLSCLQMALVRLDSCVQSLYIVMMQPGIMLPVIVVTSIMWSQQQQQQQQQPLHVSTSALCTVLCMLRAWCQHYVLQQLSMQLCS